MSDIFLSYAAEDRMKAAKLAAFFEQRQWTVWWEPDTIAPGADYARVIAEELASAKVVVLLWSSGSPGSPFILLTLQGLGRVPLIPVQLEKEQLPMWLFLRNPADLSDWDGSPLERPTLDMGVQSLLGRISSIIYRASSGTAPAAPSDSPRAEPGDELQQQEGRTNSPPEGDERFEGVFISYRRNEASAYAGRLYDRLAARFGKGKVFIDTENVGWGEDFVEAITAAAESCAVMIALISPRWSRGGQEDVDDYVRLEVAKALGRKILVIPILIQGASMPAPKELPEDLAPLVRRNALALSDTRWERDVEDLMKTLEGLLKG